MKKQAPFCKVTFRNLPEEKRRRVIEEAVREFSINGYRKASLNTIVKRLGIAKGSLYQYFDNKEALFLYIFERFTALVKETVKDSVAGSGTNDFFVQLKQVLLAGIRFIDQYPDYFQIYLKVLFEQDIPFREELVRKVRLFSAEYFGPVCDAARKQGQIRRDVSTRMIVFILDAVLDKFLQAYAQPYLDGGLGLAQKGHEQLRREADSMMKILRDGLLPQDKGE